VRLVGGETPIPYRLSSSVHQSGTFSGRTHLFSLFIAPINCGVSLFAFSDYRGVSIYNKISGGDFNSSTFKCDFGVEKAANFNTACIYLQRFACARVCGCGDLCAFIFIYRAEKIGSKKFGVNADYGRIFMFLPGDFTTPE
jgi:hypothetical protein